MVKLGFIGFGEAAFNIAKGLGDEGLKGVIAYDKFWKEARPLMVNETAPMSRTRPYHVLYNKQVKETGIPKWKAPKF